MSLVATYTEHLKRRGTGLSMIGWYIEAAKQGAPWILVAVILWAIGFSVPEPNRLAAMFALVIPAFVGWVYSQAVMFMAYLKDHRTRTGGHNG